MKTIKQVANELNISTQAIYYKINKSMKEKLQDSVIKLHGQAFIDENGCNLIKESLQPLQILSNDMPNEIADDIKSSTNIIVEDSEKKSLNEQIIYLRNQNQLLQDELIKEREHNREQSDKVISLAEQLAELNRNNQVLLRQAQEQNTLHLPQQFEVAPSDEETSTEEKKQSFFKRLFKKSNNT